MKKSTAIILAIGILLVIALCLANIVISLSMPENEKLNRSIDQRIAKKVEQEVGNLPTPQNGVNGIDGQDGTDGTTTTIEKQVVIQQVAEKPKDGINGRDGKDGKDGQNGRTPVLNVDEETGDVLVRYEGDTLWSLLIEGCKLRKDCEKL